MNIIKLHNFRFILVLLSFFINSAIYSFEEIDPFDAPEVTASENTNEGVLELNWNSVTDALFYHVEWTWIDNYGTEILDITDTLGADDIPFSEKDFRHNNTRTQTQNTSYSIPLTYGKGFVVYRVRAVGVYAENANRYKYTRWSTFSEEPKTHIEDWYDSGSNKDSFFEIENDHEENINWQYQASYAEEGKKKEVVSYFDGTLRNRQVQSKINTDNRVIVGESIYDAQGRQAIEVLPVPTNATKIAYQENFTKNAEGVSYSFQDFDKDSDNVIDEFTETKAMSTNSGAAKYYSSNNDVLGPHQAYIPKAEGYPFSQIEYTPDNTGRIQRKSGVGKMHQFGNEHEMEYYYGTPADQKELDRLFGYSVGDYKRYKKNLVIDPNDQASVSYIDPQGKTIATALVGVRPSHVDADDSIDDEANNELHERLTSVFFSGNADGNNHTNSSSNYGNANDQNTFSASKLTPSRDIFTFQYELENISNFTYSCNELDSNPYSVPVYYDLYIEIRDKESTLLGSVNELVNSSSTYSKDLPDLEIQRGAYTVSKNLRVNKEKLEEAADAYLSKFLDPNDSCYIAQGDTSLLPEIIMEGCYQSCDECLVDLFGTDENGNPLSESQAIDNYVENQLLNYDFSQLSHLSEDEITAETVNLTSAFIAQFEQAIDLCNAPCDDTAFEGEFSISCSLIKEDLFNDMLPAGQYGFATSGITEAMTNPSTLSSDILNIYNEDNKLYSTKTSDSEINNSWKNPFHPEKDGTKNANTLVTNGHYYNVDGTISYVDVRVIRTIEYTQVETDNGDIVDEEDEVISFEPEIDNELFSDAYLEGREEVKVEPFQLLNVADFISEEIWQDNWANSLITYHPEYAYYAHSLDVCNHLITQSNGEKLNSDGYDSFLYGIETYSEALSYGLIEKSFSGATNEYATIAVLDPYFSNADSSSELYSLDISNYRFQLIEEALQVNYDDSGYPLMQNTLGIMLCNSINDCQYLTGSNISEGDILAQVETLSEEDQNRFWQNYKSSYLSVKSKIKTLFADVYAKQENGYNGCIGNKPPPNNILDIMGEYDSSVLDGIENLYNNSSDSICGDSYADEYTSKSKRYIPADSDYDASADKEDVIYEMELYVNREYTIETGQCPKARDLELFLNNFFVENPSSAANYNQQYNGQYLSVALYEELGGVHPNAPDFNVVSQPDSSDNLQLNISLQTTPSTDTVATLNLSPQSLSALGTLSNINWNTYGNDWFISELTQIYYKDYSSQNQLFSFEILATVKSSLVSPEFEEVIISGTTPARIGECSLTEANGVGEFLGESAGGSGGDECSIRYDFNSAMRSLLNYLLNNENINSTVSLDVPEYTNSFLAEFLGNDNPTWKANGTVYTIESGGQTVLTLNMSDLLTSPSSVFVRSFYSVYEENAQGGIDAQRVNISFGSRRRSRLNRNNLEGTLTKDGKQLINMLCCSDINNSTGDLGGSGGTGTPCNSVLDDLVDGSFEVLQGENFINGFLSGVYDIGVTGGGFYNGRGTADAWFEPNSTSTLIGAHPESPQGGVFAGLVTHPSNDESFYTNIDIIEGHTYVVSFWQSFTKYGGHDINDVGHIVVDFNGVEYHSNDVSWLGEGNEFWQKETLEIVATETKEGITVEFDVDNSITELGGAGIYIVVDDIQIYDTSISDDCVYEGYSELEGVVDGTFEIFRDDIEVRTDGKGTLYPNSNVTESDANFSSSWTNGGGSADTWLPPLDNSSIALGMQESPESGGVFAGAIGLGNGNESFYVDLHNLVVGDTYRVAFHQSNAGWTSVNRIVGALAGWHIRDFDNSDYSQYLAASTPIPYEGVGLQTWHYDEIEFVATSTDLNLEFTPYIPDSQEYFVPYMAIDDIKLYNYTQVVIDGGGGTPVNTDDLVTIDNTYTYTNTSDYNTPADTRSCSIDESTCIPQTVQPVSCSEAYPIFELLVNQLNDANEEVEKEAFCNANFSLLVEDYQYYLETMGILSSTLTVKTDHLFYISIADFGATSFGYGYRGPEGSRGLKEVIDLYLAEDVHTDVIPPKTWSQHASTFFDGSRESDDTLTSIEMVCPPKPLPTSFDSIEVPVPEQNECEQFRASVQEAYNRDVYESYLGSAKEEFITAYLNYAMENASEELTMEYFDKEYQYTLYYYDQSGNLIQTVPPEGVNRFTETELLGGTLANIKAHRENASAEDQTLLPKHDLITEYRYNSLNQLVWQKTPDGGETRFAYDELGRIIASQNQKQFNKSNPVFCGEADVTDVNATPPLTLAAANNVNLLGNGNLTVVNPIAEQDQSTRVRLNATMSSNSYLEYSIAHTYVEDVETIVEGEKIYTATRTQKAYLGLAYSTTSTSPETFNYVLKTDVNTHAVKTESTPSVEYQTLKEHGSNTKRIRVERSNGKLYYYIDGEFKYVEEETNTGDLYINFLFEEGQDIISDISVGNYQGNNDCNTGSFSYTLYDKLGRIVEAGEMIPNVDLQIEEETGKLTYQDSGEVVPTNIESTFPANVSNIQNQVNVTTYNKITEPALVFNNYNDVAYQANTRNRVSAIYFYDQKEKGNSAREYENAVYYNYDIHGNVKEIVSHNKLLQTDPSNFYSGIKHVNYEYDLISGNVHQVTYQKGMIDQFIHKYSYDADNRITSVQTSSDGENWETDAEYQYYAHGPLARVLLGEEKVQAMDYAYTLQGWLKGVNSEGVDSVDIGNDGDQVAKDAFAYSLNYNEDDYDPITAANPFVIAQEQNVNTRNLYNGNIKTMVTSIMDANENNLPTLQSNYAYDQLNRIKKYQAYNLGETDLAYEASYTYDRNGNIEELSRSIGALEDGDVFDTFNYYYKKDAETDRNIGNQLHLVEDPSGAKSQDSGVLDLPNQLEQLEELIDGYTYDADNDATHNYVYDEIGQLVEDRSEGLTIDWRMDGKISKVNKADGTEITFIYDGLGNRISKIMEKDSSITQTHYARDTQGNVMAVYDGSGGKVTITTGEPIAVDPIVDAVDPSGALIQGKNSITTTTIIGADQNQDFKAGSFIDMLPGFHAITGSNSVLAIGEIEDASTTQEVDGFLLKEQHIYGSSRLGLQETEIIVAADTPTDTFAPNVLGDKRYELSNYLGNVLSVITDQKLFDEDNNTFAADVIAYNDYYPFGMLLPGRHGNTFGYRYSFNGMEADTELKGLANSYTTHFRQYDPRIARWLSSDPLLKQMPWQSPYVGMDNKPIIRNDVNGDCPTCVSGFIIGGLMDMAFQIGEHMLEGDDIGAAFKKVDYWQVGGAATLGGITGAFDGGISKFAGALADPKKRKILTKVIEFGMSTLLESAIQAGYDVSGVESKIYGLLGKDSKGYKEIGEIASKKTEGVIKSSYEAALESGEYGVAKEVFAKNLEGGKNTYFDFVVYNKETGEIIEVVESKGHFHDTKDPSSLKSGQKDFYDKGKQFQFADSDGVPEILKNKKLSKSSVKATVRRWSVHKYTGKTKKLTKNAISKILKKIK